MATDFSVHLAPQKSPQSKQPVPPPYSVLTVAELPEARKNPNNDISPEPNVASFPAHLALLGFPRSKQPGHLHTRSTLGQTQVLQDSLEQTPMDDPHADMGTKLQLNSRSRVTKEED